MQELSANPEREDVTIGLEVVNRYESNGLNPALTRALCIWCETWDGFVLDRLATTR